MDITLLRTSVFDLPSKQRVGAIVYDGAADMQIWPGPGSDSDIKYAHGGEMQRALDTEIKRVPGRELAIGEVIRVHPGRLHCNFLAWVATRPPEPGTKRQPAPSLQVIGQAVESALAFVAERSVERVAFGPFGGGPGEADRVDRLVAIVRAAQAYQKRCSDEGRAPVVEEVLVCEPEGAFYRLAAREVRGVASAETPAPKPRREAAPTKKRAPRKTTKKPSLDPDEVVRHRVSAARYSMKKTYEVDDWMEHPKFGTGKVTEVIVDGGIMVLFADGAAKRLVHGRG